MRTRNQGPNLEPLLILEFLKYNHFLKIQNLACFHIQSKTTNRLTYSSALQPWVGVMNLSPHKRVIKQHKTLYGKSANFCYFIFKNPCGRP